MREGVLTRLLEALGRRSLRFSSFLLLPRIIIYQSFIKFKHHTQTLSNIIISFSGKVPFEELSTKDHVKGYVVATIFHIEEVQSFGKAFADALGACLVHPVSSATKDHHDADRWSGENERL